MSRKRKAKDITFDLFGDNSFEQKFLQEQAKNMQKIKPNNDALNVTKRSSRANK